MQDDLTKKLKDAGFPTQIIFCDNKDCSCKGRDILQQPTLSELIDACGEAFHMLIGPYEDGDWGAFSIEFTVFGKTKEEAVAKLWLKSNGGKSK